MASLSSSARRKKGGRKEEERRKKGGRKEARVGNAEFGMPIFLCVSAPLREVPL
jgi:hypothetical protein